MNNYSAVVAKLENVRKHPNADRLLLADAAFEQVIISLEHQEGEVGVFVPAGTALSPDFLLANKLYRKHPVTGEAMGGYIEANGRVRFQKLRGEMSRGLWLPMSCLDYLRLKQLPALGASFAELEGHEICAKYEERTATHKQGKQRKAPSELFENFYRVGDTPKLVNNLHQLQPGDVLVITEKLHGTSGRTGYMPYKKQPRNWMDKIFAFFDAQRNRKYGHVSGTRQTILTENPHHAKDNYRQIAHDLLQPFLSRGMVVYYEIVGLGIMPNHSPDGVEDKRTRKEIYSAYGNDIAYTYGEAAGNYGIYVYKIVEHNPDGAAITYSWEQLEDWCALRGLGTVPVLAKIIYEGDRAELMRWVRATTTGSSRLCETHPIEGVVVQTRYGPMKHKGDLFCLLEDIRPYEEPEEEAVV